MGGHPFRHEAGEDLNLTEFTAFIRTHPLVVARGLDPERVLRDYLRYLEGQSV